ncbi:hypothetical protein VCCP1035_1500A, partial [Vibrio cholerae CP1035(8)]
MNTDDHHLNRHG